MAMRPNCPDDGVVTPAHIARYDSHLPGDDVWIETPFQALVRGTSRAGERFALDTVLDGLSSSALALRLRCEVEVGRPLFVVVWLGDLPGRRGPGTTVAARGAVTVMEPRPGGAWRVVVALERHRFLYARAV